MMEGKYKPHGHHPRNVNHLHQGEREQSGINQRIAVGITKATGTMTCAYAFLLLALFGFPALSTWLGPTVAIYVVWISQTLIQLCMLPILSVGQSVISRKQEIQADEEFDRTVKIYHDTELVIAQNNVIIQHYLTLINEVHRLQSTVNVISGEQLKHTELLKLPPAPKRRVVSKGGKPDETAL